MVIFTDITVHLLNTSGALLYKHIIYGIYNIIIYLPNIREPI